jgi:hypothetical protein
VTLDRRSVDGNYYSKCYAKENLLNKKKHIARCTIGHKTAQIKIVSFVVLKYQILSFKMELLFRSFFSYFISDM